jgi:hypothetical protein
MVGVGFATIFVFFEARQAWARISNKVISKEPLEKFYIQFSGEPKLHRDET